VGIFLYLLFLTQLKDENLSKVVINSENEIEEKVGYSIYLPIIFSQEEESEKNSLEEIFIPTPIPKEVDRIVEIRLDSESYTPWYRSFWKDKLYIKVASCSPVCSAEQINKELGEAFSSTEYWVALQVGQVLYTHSGWHLQKGPDLGEAIRITENYEIALDSDLYVKVERVYLDRIDIQIDLNSLFREVNEDDIFISTCDGNGTIVDKLTLVQKTN
jgi:hypothetical protein